MTACGHKGREVDKSKNRAMINVIVIPDSDLEAGDVIIVRKRCVCGACLSWLLATFALQDQRSLMADDFRVFVLSSEQLVHAFPSWTASASALAKRLTPRTPYRTCITNNRDSPTLAP